MPGTKEHLIKIDFYKRKEGRKKAKLDGSAKMSDLWKVRKDKMEAINTVGVGVVQCSPDSFRGITLPMPVSILASLRTQNMKPSSTKANSQLSSLVSEAGFLPQGSTEIFSVKTSN